MTTSSGSSVSIASSDPSVSIASSDTSALFMSSDPPPSVVETDVSNTVVVSPMSTSGSGASQISGGCSSTCSSPQTSICLASPHSSSSNPLVAAGLISPDLANILATPADNAAVSKPHVKRIVGARNLTSNEYIEMFRKDKKRKEEIEEEKKKKKEARERKKKEMNEKKRLKEMRGRGRGRGKGSGCGKGSGRGKGRGRGKRGEMDTGSEKGACGIGEARVRSRPNDTGGNLDSIDQNDNIDDSDREGSNMEDDDDSVSFSMPDIIEHSDNTSLDSSRPPRRRQMPSRFRVESDESDNDGTLCVLCNSNEPATLSSSTVFWVDCSKCGCWVHNVCAFGKNTVTRQYICQQCSS